MNRTRSAKPKSEITIKALSAKIETKERRQLSAVVKASLSRIEAIKRGATPEARDAVAFKVTERTPVSTFSRILRDKIERVKVRAPFIIIRKTSKINIETTMWKSKRKIARSERSAAAE